MKNSKESGDDIWPYEGSDSKKRKMDSSTSKSLHIDEI